MFGRLIAVSAGFTLMLHAALLDDDLDGVANEDDRCPNSAITDIVGADGCAVEKVQFKKEHHFDLSGGFSYSRLDSNTSQSTYTLSMGYYYGRFSASFYTSDYSLMSGETGMNDATVALYYRLDTGKIPIRLGMGGYIPTEDSAGNKTDYFVTAKASYYADHYDLSMEVEHTFMQDTQTRDSDRMTLSTGYTLSPKSYLALSYTIQESIYREESALQDVGLYCSYTLDRHWFITSWLSKGISASAVDLGYGVSLGYYF